MAEPGDTGEIVKRGIEYPFANPGRSFIQLGTQTLDLPAGGPDLGNRTPLLAYGANASPEVLARKLAALPDTPLPLILAELEDFDVVYSAHVSPYGAVPATLQRSPGTTVSVFVAHPTPEQRRMLDATEPNYELRRLTSIRCRLDDGGWLEEVDAYVSRHGCLTADGSEVALKAVAAEARAFRQMDQSEARELVRDRPPSSFPRTPAFFT